MVVAADIGVRTPHAGDAGPDPLSEMYARKVERYSAHSSDLEAQGIVYEPMIFSSYGRRHPRTTNMLKVAATRAARRRGWSSAAGLKKWWERQLAAELWRRAARMVHACFPKAGDWRAVAYGDQASEEVQCEAVEMGGLAFEGGPFEMVVRLS